MALLGDRINGTPLRDPVDPHGIKGSSCAASNPEEDLESGGLPWGWCPGVIWGVARSITMRFAWLQLVVLIAALAAAATDAGPSASSLADPNAPAGLPAGHPLIAKRTGTGEVGSSDGRRDFWSFQPPVAQPRPRVRNPGWSREPMDDFILARLEAAGLEPSPEADRLTLIRRVTYDLTGLPPTPDEVESFERDTGSDAYSRLVDRLLASPRLGERLASLWLPLARYAEDQAHQVGDDTTMAYPNAYRYRDWVIQAFNRDLPYDQFVRLQLAADRMEEGKGELAALGFLGLGPKYYDRERLEVQADEWEDRVDTVTRTVLGLTVACARCHDHKFDPIPTQDYYALAGVFASTRMVNRAGDGSVVPGKVKAEQMPPDALHMVEDGTPQDLNIFVRGRVSSKGPIAERRFLSVLSEGDSDRFRDGSGRRELADRLVSRDNPLAARVMVNRLWGSFFGKPLVSTPSDFGHSGMRPTHAALLDDLAVRFMNGGWSIHGLVREFVRSATYRQASRARPEAMALDAANTTLWRMNRRRLTVEQWRDAVLYVTGDLAWEGGKSMELDDPLNRRRTVHSRISRLKLNDVLMQFDYPDANVHAERRSVTTTSTQKLFLLNGRFVLDRAAAFSARLRAARPDSDQDRIEAAYRWTTGRLPDAVERELGEAFLREPDAPGMSRWEQYAQVLLVSNEMLYVD